MFGRNVAAGYNATTAVVGPSNYLSLLTNRASMTGLPHVRHHAWLRDILAINTCRQRRIARETNEANTNLINNADGFTM